MSAQRKTISHYIFMSAELAGVPAGRNVERTNAMRAALKAAVSSVRDVQGCYAGTKEAAFWVSVCSPAEMAACVALARTYGQESILIIHPATYEATLSFVDSDESTPIGTMRSVSTIEAERDYSDAYTLIPGTDHALVCA